VSYQIFVPKKIPNAGMVEQRTSYKRYGIGGDAIRLILLINVDPLFLPPTRGDVSKEKGQKQRCLLEQGDQVSGLCFVSASSGDRNTGDHFDKKLQCCGSILVFIWIRIPDP